MPDDVIKIILTKLDRIEAKQDKQTEQLATLNAKDFEERIDKINERVDKNDERVTALENSKSEFMGAKAFVVWIITIAVTIYFSK